MQTTYNEAMAAGVAGQLVDNTLRRVESKYAENAFDPGEAVQAGTTDGQVKTVAASVYGVAVQHSGVTLDENGSSAYAQYDGVSVLVKGRVWVAVDAAVAVGAAAYWDIAASAFNSDNANVAVSGGKFVTSTTGAGLAILEIS